MRVPSRAATWRCSIPGTIPGEWYQNQIDCNLLGAWPKAMPLEVEDRGEPSARVVFVRALAGGRRRRDHRRGRVRRQHRRRVVAHRRARAGAHVERDVDVARDREAQTDADLGVVLRRLVATADVALLDAE